MCEWDTVNGTLSNFGKIQKLFMILSLKFVEPEVGFVTDLKLLL